MAAIRARTSPHPWRPPRFSRARVAHPAEDWSRPPAAGMADFALWAAACETAVWPPGTFDRAYEANRRAAIAGIIDADPVAACGRRYHVQSWGPRRQQDRQEACTLENTVCTVSTVRVSGPEL
jgi:hypothetical protein